MKTKKRINKKSVLVLIITTITMFFLSAGSPIYASTLKKVPLLDGTQSIEIPNQKDVAGFIRFKDQWVITDSDSNLKSIKKSGEVLWQASPLISGQAGDGVITVVTTDGTSLFITGLSQNPLTKTTTTVPSPSPSASATATTSPQVSPSPVSTPTKKIPLVNPDNISQIDEIPFRKDLVNIFVARLDSSGNLVSSINTANENQFIPTSIAVRDSKVFVSGNEQIGENATRGAVYLFNDEGFISSFRFGQSNTHFNKIVVNSSTSFTVVGSSSETIVNRKSSGSQDGIILTISQSTGKILKIVRSSGPGAKRSWDYAEGELLVVGSSETKSLKESVITSFTSQGVVRWTTKYQKSDGAFISDNCVAVSLLAASSGLPFKATGPEIFVYTVDSKGAYQKGARLAKYQLLALTSAPNSGCAVLTKSRSGSIQLSFL